MLNRKLAILVAVIFGLMATIISAQEPFINDGRLNNFDAAAPIVIYPTAGGGLDIYLVDPATGGGILTLSVPPSTLAVRGVYLLARNDAGTVNVFKEGDEFVITGIAPNLETYVFRITDPTTNLGFRAYTLHYPIYTTAEELGVPIEEAETIEESTPVVTTEEPTEAAPAAPSATTPAPSEETPPSRRQILGN